jgi:hypothetical protein
MSELFLQEDIDKAEKKKALKKKREEKKLEGKKEFKESESDLKFKNIKYYCKKYGIPVKVGDKWLSVGVLSNKIYNYERQNNVKGGFYPFLA